MVKAYSNATRVRVHPSQTQMLATGAAIAAGAQARPEGVPVVSLDCTGCKAMLDPFLLHIFQYLGTLRWLSQAAHAGLCELQMHVHAMKELL
jgi:hypothetical protein